MGLDSRISWIIGGRLSHVLPADLANSQSESSILADNGAVKIIETPEGVTFKWVVFAANWMSLYSLIELLYLYDGPFVLNYFLSGWFSEKIESRDDVKTRLAQLIAKSDVFVSQHTYVREIDPAKAQIPHVLRDTLTDQTAIPELSVDCVFDEDTNSFVVQRVGGQSAIAKVYGMSPVSTPCLTGNSYDDVISEGYLDVLKRETPRYDHVLAAMMLPDRSVIWAPYQRVILPHYFPDGRKGVSVISERTDVDIKLI